MNLSGKKNSISGIQLPLAMPPRVNVPSGEHERGGDDTVDHGADVGQPLPAVAVPVEPSCHQVTDASGEIAAKSSSSKIPWRKMPAFAPRGKVKMLIPWDASAATGRDASAPGRDSSRSGSSSAAPSWAASDVKLATRQSRLMTPVNVRLARGCPSSGAEDDGTGSSGVGRRGNGDGPLPSFRKGFQLLLHGCRGERRPLLPPACRPALPNPW